ncbi:MAG: indole-3-glycerol-phosphate synthase [Spirochaetes bacterium]|jgi:indole-3-glycerol phosphate synthase|nr:indole-3-glycerol-phosphate synthase [Spirochaetota bacterium]
MNKFELMKMRDLKSADLDELRRTLENIKPRSRPSYQFSPLESQINIIAEVKKSSPTQQLNLSADVVLQAQMYQQGGAGAISVLTDANFFSGSYDDLRRVANAVSLPVLCKEFVYFTEQIELASRYGADMILLIAQTLSDEELLGLYSYAMERSVVPIVEINRADEIDRVMSIDPEIVMVNMRNLNTLVIDCDAGADTLRQVPDSVIRISASGMNTSDDVKTIADDTNVNVFLIGSALMKSGDPSKFVKELAGVL